MKNHHCKHQFDTQSNERMLIMLDQNYELALQLSAFAHDMFLKPYICSLWTKWYTDLTWIYEPQVPLNSDGPKGQ